MRIYDFKNPDDWSELERQAYAGNVNVEGFPPAAYRYFDSLRKLYHEYRFEGLPLEQAELKKKKLLSQYRETIDIYNDYCKVYGNYQENIRHAGMLLTQIEKSQDTETIALLACEAIQCMTGECTFFKRQEKKIKKSLERQIPKKPKKYVDLYGSTKNDCPVCSENEILYAGQKYCSVCGQAIDWSK